MVHCNCKVQSHVIHYYEIKLHIFVSVKYCTKPNTRRSQWPPGLRSQPAAARLLRLWVRIPTEAWMFVSCECCVLSGRGLCDGLITRPEESYWLWCVWVWSWILNNEETFGPLGLIRHGKKKLIHTYSPIWIRPIHQCVASYALMVIVSTPPPQKKKNEKCGTTFLPNPSRLPKEKWFSEVSQVSLISHSGESRT
jgi:hypothetical protein